MYFIVSHTLYFFNIFILFLAFVGVHCCTGFLSCCSKQGLLSSCGAQASPWSGFSCSREWAVGHSGLQQLWQMDLVFLWHVSSSWIRDQTCVSILAGGFFTTDPPGQPYNDFKIYYMFYSRIMSIFRPVTFQVHNGHRW